MAKQYKEYDRSFVANGQWTELVRSLQCGIYDIQMPDYRKLRSLQVILSRFNRDPQYPLRFTITVNYERINLHIDVDKK